MSTFGRWIAVACAVLLCLAGATAVAQDSYALATERGDTTFDAPGYVGAADPGSSPGAPDAYGTGWTAVGIMAYELHPYWTGLGYGSVPSVGIYAQTGDPWRYFDTSVTIPTGALVYGVTPFVYDNDATGNIQMWIWQYAADGGVAMTQDEIWTYTTSGTPGYTGAYMSFASPVTWRNFDIPGDRSYFYHFRVHLGVTGTTNGFEGLTIWYLRQVSPAPAVATFGDVPVSHPWFQWIEALASSGITAGCGGGDFCPNNPVTRGQMAIFLARGLGLDWPDS